MSWSALTGLVAAAHVQEGVAPALRALSLILCGAQGLAWCLSYVCALPVDGSVGVRGVTLAAVLALADVDPAHLAAASSTR